MLDIVLYEPEIPPNTGNLIRLAANTGCRLHLVRPLGFSLNDRALKRSGLDYADLAHVTVHRDWQSCSEHFAGRTLYALSTRARRRYTDARFARDDVLVFGPETRGLPEEVLEGFPEERRLRLPMVPGSRSLNLANAAAVVVYEAWRQLDFAGAV
ncbi:MAG: tRNA (cytidine(34)-2'-O)-methyltransferase [Pseudomonadota bacterium]